MVRELRGNLLADDAEALVNTVNTVGAMGKGIALQFKRAFPDMYRAYEADAKAGLIRPGRMHVWENLTLSGPRYVINFPTKRHWRSPSRLEDIQAGLTDLRAVLRDLDVASVALPPLGCGNGGLAWSTVEPLIREALSDLEGVDVRLYAPAGAPPAREMLTRGEAPPLTPARAALIGLVEAYRGLTWSWPTHFDIQKLAYFLQASGYALGLRFEKGHYGPYADNLRATLSGMEGHQLLGFGDGSRRALEGEPIQVLDGAATDARALLAADPMVMRHVERVLSLVEAFASTYGLELLASVHWAACSGVTGPESAARVIREWTRRKATLFGEEHVRIAWEALHDGGWLDDCRVVAAS